MRAVGRKFNIAGQEGNKAVQRARRSRRWKALGAPKTAELPLESECAPSAADPAMPLQVIDVNDVITSIDRAASHLEQGDSSAWEALVAFLEPVLRPTPNLLRSAVRSLVAEGRGDEVIKICRDYEEQTAVILALEQAVA